MQDRATDARLRVIFDNGTESNMLMRSLQRALKKTKPVGGSPIRRRALVRRSCPRTAMRPAARSMCCAASLISDGRREPRPGAQDRRHQYAASRSASPARKLEPTFLMADVEVVATYELYNINRTKLENLIHRIFAPARLDIEIKIALAIPLFPREWFLVPLFAINEAVEKILRKNGAPGRIRTRDPLITNQVLYQLSYKGSGMRISYSPLL
jgi:hypothetical protein